MVLGFLGAIGLWFLRNHLGNRAQDALKDEVKYFVRHMYTAVSQVLWYQ